MLDRESCERRVYRLALLLTGRARSAAAVIEQVVGAQPKLQNLDGSRLDRLTVLRSREQRSGPLQLPDAAIARALAGLTSQQREAWIFVSLYKLDTRTAAKAMDCSFHAVGHHHDEAQRAMHTALGDRAAEAPAAVRELMLTIDVPEFYRGQQRRQQHMRRSLIIAVIIVSALGVLAAVSWLAQMV